MSQWLEWLAWKKHSCKSNATNWAREKYEKYDTLTGFVYLHQLHQLHEENLLKAQRKRVKQTNQSRKQSAACRQKNEKHNVQNLGSEVSLVFRNDRGVVDLHRTHTNSPHRSTPQAHAHIPAPPSCHRRYPIFFFQLSGIWIFGASFQIVARGRFWYDMDMELENKCKNR